MGDITAESLSPEILRKIFLYCGPKCWTFSLPYVCQSWKQVMDSIWNNVEILEFRALFGLFNITLTTGEQFSFGNLAKKADVLKLLLHNCGKSVKSITLCGSKEFDEETFLFLGQHCENLRQLKLGGAFGHLHSYVEPLCEKFKDTLQELYLCGEKFSTEDTSFDDSLVIGSFLNVCTNLRTIDIEIDGGLNLEVAFCSITKLAYLECFGVSICRFCVDPNYVQNLLSCVNRRSSALKQVRLFFDCPESLSGVEENCRQLFMSLDKDKSVENMEICLGFNDNSNLLASIFLFPLVGFQNLHELTVKHFDFSDNVALLALQELAPRLTFLHLLQNMEIDNIFKRLSTKMIALKTLEITVVESVCSESLSNFLLSKCPKLNILVLNNVAYFVWQSFILKLYTALRNCASNDFGDSENLIVRSNSCVDGVALSLSNIKGLSVFVNAEYISFKIERQCCSQNK